MVAGVVAGAFARGVADGVDGFGDFGSFSDSLGGEISWW